MHPAMHHKTAATVVDSVVPSSVVCGYSPSAAIKDTISFKEVIVIRDEMPNNITSCIAKHIGKPMSVTAGLRFWILSSIPT